MEDRGTGIMRMTGAMLDHGLDRPGFAPDDDCVVVTLPGPADNMNRIRVPEGISTELTPAQEEALNERQRRILEYAVETGAVTSGWCRKEFDVTYDTANRDLLAMMQLGLIRREGKGRGSRYVPFSQD